MAQEIMDIQPDELVAQAAGMRTQGARLVQICCTKLADRLELLYSFDREFALTSFRVTLAGTAAPIPSISSVYLAAFLYENEIHDLFGVSITGIAVDYQGKFYQTTMKTPFNPPPAAGEDRT